MAKKFTTIVILVAALIVVEYFAANMSAYALNELTRYQVTELVVFIAAATVAVDVIAISIFASKDPNASSGYLMGAWFLAFTLRAGLIRQGLIFGFAVTHSEWLAAIAPAPLTIFVWLLNLLLVWMAGKAIKMPVEQPESIEP